MQLIDLAKLSTRMFKTNPARTWLTILGMGVGTGAVVVLVGLGFGLQGVLLEQIVFGETLLSLNVSSSASEVVNLDDEAVEDFLNIENVLDVAPRASFPALITYGDLTGNVFLEGLNPAYLRYVGTQTEAGEVFTEETRNEDRKSVLITSSVLKLFGVENVEDIIGEQVTFRIFLESDGGVELREVVLPDKYSVKGVTNDATSLSAQMLMEELSEYVAITVYDRAQVRVSKTDFLSETTDIIIEKGFNVTALSKTVEQATKIFQGVQAVLASFGGIALIVSAIGMFNTMTVTLLERTGEIGIMRTIGASSIDIKILFVAEAVIVGFLGGLMGIAIGMGIGITLNTGINFLASQYGGVAVKMFRFPFWFLAFISSFSGVVGFMTGIFPATRAAALNPLDAIRYK